MLSSLLRLIELHTQPSRGSLPSDRFSPKAKSLTSMLLIANTAPDAESESHRFVFYTVPVPKPENSHKVY